MFWKRMGMVCSSEGLVLWILSRQGGWIQVVRQLHSLDKSLWLGFCDVSRCRERLSGPACRPSPLDVFQILSRWRPLERSLSVQSKGHVSVFVLLCVWCWRVWRRTSDRLDTGRTRQWVHSACCLWSHSSGFELFGLCGGGNPLWSWKEPHYAWATKSGSLQRKGHPWRGSRQKTFLSSVCLGGVVLRACLCSQKSDLLASGPSSLYISPTGVKEPPTTGLFTPVRSCIRIWSYK